MNDNIELAYDKVDVFLKKLNETGGDTILNLSDLHSTSGSIAFNILFDERLITSRKGFKDKTGIVDIAPLGIYVLSIGGIRMFTKARRLQEIEDNLALDVQRSRDKVDLELSKKTLEDFPTTKKRATIAFWIAIALAIFELMKFLLQLTTSK